MSGYCPDCGNTLCLCDKITRVTYSLRYRINELETNASILIGALEEISKSTYEANPWTIVKTKDAEIADKALLKYKGIKE